MSVTGFPLAPPALLVVPPSGCHKPVNTFSNQSIKGHSKDKLEESKLMQAVHLYFQITNLISYYKISKLQIYPTDPIY